MRRIVVLGLAIGPERPVAATNSTGSGNPPLAVADRDGEGILDLEDACPDTPASRARTETVSRSASSIAPLSTEIPMSFLERLFGRRRPKATPAEIGRALMEAAAEGATTAEQSLHAQLIGLDVDGDYDSFEYLTELLTFALLPVDMLAGELGTHASSIRRGLRMELEALAREALGEVAEWADWAYWRDHVNARLLEYTLAMQTAEQSSGAYSTVGRVASQAILKRVDPRCVAVLATHFALCLEHFSDVIDSIEVLPETRGRDRVASEARQPDRGAILEDLPAQAI